MLDLNHFIDLYKTLPNYYQKKKKENFIKLFITSAFYFTIYN